MLPISVMIPAYVPEGGSWDKVKRCLSSVPRELVAQVEIIVDGGSRPPDELAGCARYFAENAGATANYNRCIRHARAPLVHILHADDTACMPFYAAIAVMAEAWPRTALLGAWYVLVMDTGGAVALPRFPSPRWLEPSTYARPLWYKNPIAASGVVIRRGFYQEHGGFNEALIHVADWEMWLRAFDLGGGVFSPAPLVHYYQSEEQHTSRLMRTADNLRDWLEMLPFLERRRGFDRDRFVGNVRHVALLQEREFRRRGDEDAAAANAAFAQGLEAAR